MHDSKRVTFPEPFDSTHYILKFGIIQFR